uniref:HAT C-terminal dimerisation domain-containing protein n=1 Tax=Meloidogyne enterolobii TaxID=390850 RepID=A0A6V7UR76_MELEN|nr:unnamed protein product [Meloidogyne enterolobii]
MLLFVLMKIATIARRSGESVQPVQLEESINDIFDEYEKEIRTELIIDSPLPSPSELNARQKAEVEVVEYLHATKLSVGSDPFIYWTGENAIKWPLLATLANKYFSAPATSSESERLFSTAGQIVSNLRKRLLPENIEKLLFLHHNLKIYNFCYE